MGETPPRQTRPYREKLTREAALELLEHAGKKLVEFNDWFSRNEATFNQFNHFIARTSALDLRELLEYCESDRERVLADMEDARFVDRIGVLTGRGAEHGKENVEGYGEAGFKELLEFYIERLDIIMRGNLDASSANTR